MPHSPSEPRWTFLLPKATSEALKRPDPDGFACCQNLHLLLHKYVPREAICRKIVAEEETGGRMTRRADDSRAEGSQKKAWLTQLEGRSTGKRRPTGDVPVPLFDPQLHEAWLSRWKRLADARGAQRFTARAAWRMVVGLGNASPLETDLLTHATYGIPYIPGSALKGAARAYARSMVEPNAPADARAAMSSVIERVFGTNAHPATNGRAATEAHAGGIVFFDGMPEWPLRLEVDIMNPHYPDYYRDTSGSRPPSSDQNPIPIFFLTLREATFHFAVAPRSDQSSPGDLAQAETWLRGAIEQLGVGAKTSAGYGSFQPVPQRSGEPHGGREGHEGHRRA